MYREATRIKEEERLLIIQSYGNELTPESDIALLTPNYEEVKIITKKMNRHCSVFVCSALTTTNFGEDIIGALSEKNIK